MSTTSIVTRCLCFISTCATMANSSLTKKVMNSLISIPLRPEASEAAAAIARDVLPTRHGGELTVQVMDEQRAKHEQYFLAQVQQSVGCNASHTVERRICRWLSRISDLVGDEFTLTQEFMAQMIGVRRTSVSLVAATSGSGSHQVSPRSYQSSRGCEA